jgi:hypothetical protein
MKIYQYWLKNKCSNTKTENSLFATLATLVVVDFRLEKIKKL